MRKLIFISLLAALYSCDIQKEAAKRKTETSINENWEQREFRPSAPVMFTPPANITLRDTTIVVVNSEGTKLRLHYDRKGNLKEGECLPALIDLVTKMTMQKEESVKEKEKSKTEDFDTSWILYLVIGISLIFCFALFLMFRSVSTQGRALTAILAKISNNETTVNKL